jgi:hypothetical protein
MSAKQNRNFYPFTNDNKNTKTWHYCNIGAYLNMNKLVALAMLATLSTTPSLATSDACKRLEEECQNAVSLSNSMTSYLSMIWKTASSTYWKTHGFIKGKIPNEMADFASPTISEDAFRNYATHFLLSASGYAIVQGTLAFLSVPFSIATLPVRNRVTMFVTGWVAKSLYDANSREAEDNK